VKNFTSIFLENFVLVSWWPSAESRKFIVSGNAALCQAAAAFK
jgi:hypothetical protein